MKKIYSDIKNEHLILKNIQLVIFGILCFISSIIFHEFGHYIVLYYYNIENLELKFDRVIINIYSLTNYEYSFVLINGTLFSIFICFMTLLFVYKINKNYSICASICIIIQCLTWFYGFLDIRTDLYKLVLYSNENFVILINLVICIILISNIFFIFRIINKF